MIVVYLPGIVEVCHNLYSKKSNEQNYPVCSLKWVLMMAFINAASLFQNIIILISAMIAFIAEILFVTFVKTALLPL